MGNKSKSKDYLVQGTILVIASFVARFIGMIYRIPLTQILGNEGNGYYSTAYEIYTIVLMVSSFSIPLAVSKLVSERLSLGKKKNANRVFICAMKFSLIMGGVMSILTFALAGVITKYMMKSEMAVYALRVMCPAIFLFAIAGCLRGVFQGHGSMVPTAVSQVVEQIVNAIVSVVCAGLMLNYGAKLASKNGNELMEPALAAAGGTFGTVASIAVALLFLLFVFVTFQRNFKRQMRKDHTLRVESDRSIYLALIFTILPVVLSTVTYNISTVLDQGIFNHVLAAQGFEEQQYVAIFGIYTGKFRVLMNVPLSIASCLAPSVVPSLSAAMAEGNYRDAKMKVRDSTRYTMTLTIPCAVGLATLASPIMQLIFGDSMSLTEGIMQHGALMIVLLALSTLSTGILQGLGELKKPLIHTAIALAAHVVMLVVMLTYFEMNIYAVIYSNIFFALVICVMNAWSIKKTLQYRQELVRTFLIPLISSGIMGVAVYGVYRLFALFAGNAVSTIIAVLVGIIVYGILLIKLRGITKREIYRLPKGAYLVAFLKKCRIL